MQKPFVAVTQIALLAFAGPLLFSAAACAQESAAPNSGAQETVAAQEAQAQPKPEEATAPEQSPASLPDVVARVNGKEITRSELLEEAEEARAQMAQMGVQQGDTPEFYRQVLDRMVAGLLLYQEAQARGMGATEAEVGQQIAAIKARFPSEEEYGKALAAQGWTPETLRQEVQENLTIQKFLENEVVSKVTVTEEAQKKFYDENLDRMRQPEQIRVSHILVQVDDGATAEEKEAARKKAAGLRERAKAGEDFAALAREHSDDPGSKDKGGELPWISPGSTVPGFDEAAFALQPGEVSAVVETSFGFHIIKAHERQAASTTPFDTVKERIGEVLKQQQVQAQIQALIESLRAKAKVDIYL